MKSAKSLLAMMMAAVTLTTSCNKTDDATPANNQPNPQTPVVNDVDGALVSLKLNYSFSYPGIPPVPVEAQIGLATMFNNRNSSSYVDVGAVSVNSNGLDKQGNNSYMKFATIGQATTDLGFSNGSSWNIAGGNGVTGFSYNHNVAFPSYTGELPTKVTRSSGVSINISSYTSNADSVYVLIAAGNQHVLKHYAASAGTVTIPASELSSLPVVTNNTGIIEVDPFRYNIQTINGKKYAFIKEYAKVAYVNID